MYLERVKNMQHKITNKAIIQEWSKVPSALLQEFGDKGDFARQQLLTPHIFDLLSDIKGKTILDAGAGTGYLSRMMAKKGAFVTAVEPAEVLIRYALEREEREKLGIEYIQEDLTAFSSQKTFDVVVANMVFMDIPDFKSAMRNCIEVLSKNGTFIFSITHPCFEMSGKEWRKKGYVVVKEYFEEYATKQMFGHAFHRTLSTYINFLIASGCCVEKIIEPRLTQKQVGDHVEYAKDVYVPSFLIVKAKKS